MKLDYESKIHPNYQLYVTEEQVQCRRRCITALDLVERILHIRVSISWRAQVLRSEFKVLIIARSAYAQLWSKTTFFPSSSSMVCSVYQSSLI
jgi:hypothetical protein